MVAAQMSGVVAGRVAIMLSRCMGVAVVLIARKHHILVVMLGVDGDALMLRIAQAMNRHQHCRQAL